MCRERCDEFFRIRHRVDCVICGHDANTVSSVGIFPPGVGIFPRPILTVHSVSGVVDNRRAKNKAGAHGRRGEDKGHGRNCGDERTCGHGAPPVVFGALRRICHGRNERVSEGHNPVNGLRAARPAGRFALTAPRVTDIVAAIQPQRSPWQRPTASGNLSLRLKLAPCTRHGLRLSHASGRWTDSSCSYNFKPKCQCDLNMRSIDFVGLRSMLASMVSAIQRGGSDGAQSTR